MKQLYFSLSAIFGLALVAVTNTAGAVPVNILSPTDPIAGLFSTVAGGPSTVDDGVSDHTPTTESALNIIDGTGKKFNTRGAGVGSNNSSWDGRNTGFYVTPQVGATVVTGIQIYTANDTEQRDPASFTLEGTNGDPNSASWTLITSGALSLPAARNAASSSPLNDATAAFQLINFSNTLAFTRYRVLFPTTKFNFLSSNPALQNLQLGEVKLLGEVSSIPEPSTISLFTVACIGLLVAQKRMRQSRTNIAANQLPECGA